MRNKRKSDEKAKVKHIREVQAPGKDSTFSCPGTATVHHLVITEPVPSCAALLKLADHSTHRSRAFSKSPAV